MPALIFDCDGVLADTERFGHLPAFNQMFARVRRAGASGPRTSTPSCSRSAAARSGWRRSSLRSSSRQDGPADRSRREQAELVAALAPAQDRHLHRSMVDAGALPAAPGRPPAVARRPPRQDGSSRSPRRPPSRLGAVRARPRGRRGRWPSASPCSPATSSPRKKPAPDIYRLAVDQLRARTGDGPSSSRTAATGMRGGARRGPDAAWSRRAATPRDEDFTGAALVVSTLGDPETVGRRRRSTADGAGRPVRVLVPTPYVRPRRPRGGCSTPTPPRPRLTSTARRACR